jgi:hypothetical protein
MKPLLIILSVFVLQDIPFKAKEDFDIKLDYTFKQRPVSDRTSVHFDESQKERDRRTSPAVLPYLILKVNLLKLPEEEVKVRIANNLNGALTNKKVQIGSTLSLDMGFTDDMKDRVSPHEYIITFVSPEKKELSRISIFIAEDGTFMVNGEKRGKF